MISSVTQGSTVSEVILFLKVQEQHSNSPFPLQHWIRNSCFFPWSPNYQSLVSYGSNWFTLEGLHLYYLLHFYYDLHFVFLLIESNGSILSPVWLLPSRLNRLTPRNTWINITGYNILCFSYFLGIYRFISRSSIHDIF